MNLKKTLLTNLKYVAFGIAIAVSISYAYAAWGIPAGTYSDPSGTPPANNTETPLNISALDQVKGGGLALSGTFLASKNAQFDSTVFLNGLVGGGTNGAFPATSSVHFGGRDANQANHPMSVTISGGLGTAASFKSDVLANADGTRALCSDATGTVTFCDIVDMCSNIAGAQPAVPAGMQQNADGTCSKAPKRFLSVTQFASYTNPNIIGGVQGGDLKYRVPTTPPPGANRPSLPWVAQAGLYNGPSTCATLSGCSQWIFNEIPGVLPTDFSGGNSRIMTVGESGTYHIVIHTSGKIGMKGKFSNSAGFLAVDLSMKVNHTWYDFGASTGIPHEAYPNPDHTKSEYDSLAGDTSGGSPVDVFGFHTGNGNQFHYLPFTADVDRTIHLNAGDTVDLTADIYGYSRYEVKFDVYDYTNWFYSIETDGATYDITEIPD